MTEEKRRFSRILFDVSSSLELKECEFNFSSIANLSVGGCLVENDQPVSQNLLGQEGVFKIFTDQKVPTVEVSGEIIRIKDKEISLKFTGIDPDSLYHLQNIIRYNADGPEQVEDELDLHPGLK